MNNKYNMKYINLKIIILTLAAIIFSAGCSVYKSPAEFESRGLTKISVFDSRKGTFLREIANTDSLKIFAAALNVNENIDYETDTTYKILMIYSAKDSTSIDTTKIYFSVHGDYFSYFNVRKNPYGKILSRATEYFRVTKPLTGYLLGTSAGKQ